MPALLAKRFGPSIFWAGLVGFLIGILFSITVWSTNRIVQLRANLPDEAGAVVDASPHLTLSISSPASGSLASSATGPIPGTTPAPTLVGIPRGSADAVNHSATHKLQTS